MTQYTNLVEKARLRFKAEKWAGEVKSLHAHQIKSCWYDDRPEDTDKGPVRDIQYNDGRIERYQFGKHIHTFGKALTGQKLIDKMIRGGE